MAGVWPPPTADLKKKTQPHILIYLALHSEVVMKIRPIFKAQSKKREQKRRAVANRGGDGC